MRSAFWDLALFTLPSPSSVRLSGETPFVNQYLHLLASRQGVLPYNFRACFMTARHLGSRPWRQDSGKGTAWILHYSLQLPRSSLINLPGHAPSCCANVSSFGFPPQGPSTSQHACGEPNYMQLNTNGGNQSMGAIFGCRSPESHGRSPHTEPPKLT